MLSSVRSSQYYKVAAACYWLRHYTLYLAAVTPNTCGGCNWLFKMAWLDHGFTLCSKPELFFSLPLTICTAWLIQLHFNNDISNLGVISSFGITYPTHLHNKALEHNWYNRTYPLEHKWRNACYTTGSFSVPLARWGWRSALSHNDVTRTFH